MITLVLFGLIALSYVRGQDPCEQMPGYDCPAMVYDADGNTVCCAESVADSVCFTTDCSSTTPEPEFCYCPTSSPTISATPSPTTKSYAKKNKGSSGIGVGDCDCDGGVTQLRFIYQGSVVSPVNIEILNENSDVYCTFDSVATGEEIVCNIDDNPALGLSKFDKETLFTITDPVSGSQICANQYHTSCSQDIVGYERCDNNEMIVSGWKDLNTPDGDCDDGLEPCECEDEDVSTEEPNEETDTEEEPTTTETTTTEEPDTYDQVLGDTCYCQNSLYGSTPSPVASKSKGKKSSKDSGSGVGDCDCDKDYGMVELRVIYSGLDSINIKWLDKSGVGQVCEDSEDVASGGEATCNVQEYLDSNGDPVYEKLETNTFLYITDSNGDDICSTEIHTSCSRDIVGTEGDGDCATGLIVVSGWRDGNPIQNTCDDGFDVCACNGTLVEEPEDPYYTPIFQVYDLCYCSNSTTLQGLTPAPTVASSKSKGSKGKRSKDSGYGVGDCDCDGGINTLRFGYLGSSSSNNIQVFYDKNLDDVICEYDDVQPGDELKCSILAHTDSNGDPIYSKMATNTYVTLTDTSTGEECTGSWHTSCSRDIIGWTAEGCNELIVTGWVDNDGGNGCDDGFYPCSCGITDYECYMDEGCTNPLCELVTNDDGYEMCQARETYVVNVGTYTNNTNQRSANLYAILAIFAVIKVLF